MDRVVHSHPRSVTKYSKNYSGEPFSVHIVLSSGRAPVSSVNCHRVKICCSRPASEPPSLCLQGWMEWNCSEVLL